MRSFGTLLLAFFLSGVIAGAAQLLIAVILRVGMEIILGMMLLAAATPLTTIALGIALATWRPVRAVDWTAAALLGLVALGAVGLVLLEFRHMNAITVTRTTLRLLVATAVSLALMIAIQWWLVRQRAQSA